MILEILTIALLAAVFVVLPIVATVAAIKDDHYSKAQRFVVIALCWLLPLVGPILAIGAYRTNNSDHPKESMAERRKRYGGNPHEDGSGMGDGDGD